MVVRWVRTMPFIFLVLGLSFGSWLGRLPAIRDHLNATTFEMSIYGLVLAIGSLLGLMVSGQIVSRFTARSVLTVGVLVQSVSLPAAAAIVLYVSIPVGLALLFVYGFAFAVADVAMNVSGAGAESAFGKPRLPLMHAGYSIGTVAATGLAALAEALRVPVPIHFAVFSALSAVIVLALLRNLPRDEQAVRRAVEIDRDRGSAASTRTLRADEPVPLSTGAIPVIDSASGTQPAFGTMTGTIGIISAAQAAADKGEAQHDRSHGGGSDPGSSGRPPRKYSPWRDKRILLAGIITFSIGLMDGTASDWLPIALVDGRGMNNDFATAMLSVFFASIMLIRLIGSWLIMRFGRVTVLRASVLLGALGIVLTITAPGTAWVLVGAACWGFGSGIGWPIAISAAADRASTAAKDVAAVSALGYGSMLVGPVAFGFLGEHIGLLTAFWALLPFAAVVVVIAGAVRPLSIPKR